MSHSSIQQKEYFDKEIKRKTAELSQAQRSVQESENMANPFNSKMLPIKDVPEARKLLEYLFDSAVDSAASSHLDKIRAKKNGEDVKKLNDELLLAQQQVRRGEKDHREEMSRMHDMTLELQQENEELKQELVKCGIPRPNRPAGSPIRPVTIKNELPRPSLKLSKVEKIKNEIQVGDSRALLTPGCPPTPIDNEAADPTFNPAAKNKRNSRRTKTLSNNSTLSKENISRLSSGSEKSRYHLRSRKSPVDENSDNDSPLFESETYDVTTNYKPVVEVGSEEDKENNVTIDISPEKANIAAPESPGLDKTYTMGLGVLNPKKTAFTPQKKRLFSARPEIGNKKSGRTIKLPAAGINNENIFTPKKL
jgi:hypothetical protein